jgi:hypothetical protein
VWSRWASAKLEPPAKRCVLAEYGGGNRDRILIVRQNRPDVQAVHEEAPRVAEKLKALCKWKTEAYAKNLAALRAIVAQPGHVCLKCGRAADRKKWLCKPHKLD